MTDFGFVEFILYYPLLPSHFQDIIIICFFHLLFVGLKGISEQPSDCRQSMFLQSYQLQKLDWFENAIIPSVMCAKKTISHINMMI